MDVNSIEIVPSKPDSYYRIADIGLSGTVTIRDLWAKKELGAFTGSFTMQVPSHGTNMLKISSQPVTGVLIFFSPVFFIQPQTERFDISDQLLPVYFQQLCFYNKSSVRLV